MTKKTQFQRRNLPTVGERVGLNIRQEYWELIKESPYSAAKLLDIVLTRYFKDQFDIRVENNLDQMHEDLMMLEMLKERGKMGITKFKDKHLLQIESYKEAIKIMEKNTLPSS